MGANGKPKRVALYLRVSTDGQTTENQRMALTEVAARRGWAVAVEYEDAGVSGSKGRDRRPGFDRLLKDATRRRFDVLMVAAIDRLGRSTAAVTAALAEMSEAGVEFYSLREAIDGTTPHGRAMLQMAAVFAELEREMIRDRVKAGLARAKAQGKRIGRPTVSAEAEAGIRARLAAGDGVLKTAKAMRVGVSTVQRIRGTRVAGVGPETARDAVRVQDPGA